MKLAMIVAVDEANGIGADNDLMWHLPDDFKWFKQHTMGHSVIMGRKTMDSLPKLLPKRNNLVISRNKDSVKPGFIHCNSPEEAVNTCSENGEERAFIIGGAMIYKHFLPLADELYITRVKTTVDKADAFFPEIVRENWNLEFREHHVKDDRHKYAFDLEIYKRK